jgi:hypothetical protein
MNAGEMSEPDSDVLGQIKQLVEEEHQLREDGEADPDRIRRIEEQLDQCWDLLRQRRAQREFGNDPGEAAPRPPSTVENYRQ